MLCIIYYVCMLFGGGVTQDTSGGLFNMSLRVADSTVHSLSRYRYTVN